MTVSGGLKLNSQTLSQNPQDEDFFCHVKMVSCIVKIGNWTAMVKMARPWVAFSHSLNLPLGATV